jgi:hypothetical protein
VKLTGFDDVDESQLLYQYCFVNGALRVVLGADSTPMIKVIKEPNGGSSALITYMDAEDADAAIRLYNSREYYGNVITMKLHDKVPTAGDRGQAEHVPTENHSPTELVPDPVNHGDVEHPRKPAHQVCFDIKLT